MLLETDVCKTTLQHLTLHGAWPLLDLETPKTINSPAYFFPEMSENTCTYTATNAATGTNTATDTNTSIHIQYTEL